MGRSDTKNVKQRLWVVNFMNRQAAEVVAIDVLGWLAGEEDYFYRFLNMTGVDTGDIPGRSKNPEFLGFVLDFLLSDDNLVIEFCQHSNRANEVPMQARAQLPGGDVPNWT